MPNSGNRVAQGVYARGDDEITTDVAMDIADIVLSRPDAAVVMENSETSNGHGHD